jgi:integrase/recombinase XerC
LTLPAGAREAVEAWLAVRGHEPGPLFTSLHQGGRPDGRLTGDAVYKIVRGLGRAAGLDRAVRPHGIRHASITEVAKRTNGNAVASQEFGRHRNPATTARYIDAFEDTFGKAAGLSNLAE